MGNNNSKRHRRRAHRGEPTAGIVPTRCSNSSAGMDASHQTGWAALVAELVEVRTRKDTRLLERYRAREGDLMKEFDLIIIGAGSGNMIPGPDHDTWHIAIIEQDKFGGTCLNRGCIPSKMLIHTAEVADTVSAAGTFGINARLIGINWHRVTGRV